MPEFRSFASILRAEPVMQLRAVPSETRTVPADVPTESSEERPMRERSPQQPVRPDIAAQPFVEPPTPPPIAPRAVSAPPATATSPQLAAIVANFASEIVRLRARAAELVESEAESMLQMMASRVLVRELEIAPADICELTRRVRDEWSGSHPLRFRVAAADVALLSSLGETLEVDPALHPGDLQVELPEGILDLRLGTRLAAVLETHRIAV